MTQLKKHKLPLELTLNEVVLYGDLMLSTAYTAVWTYSISESQVSFKEVKVGIHLFRIVSTLVGARGAPMTASEIAKTVYLRDVSVHDVASTRTQIGRLKTTLEDAGSNTKILNSKADPGVPRGSVILR